MKKMILSAAGILLAFAPAFGRDMGDVLKEIEKGNLELQTKKLANSATVYDLAAENMPDAPSVEYSPFFHKGVSGVSSSELVVSQEFDFPTLYSSPFEGRKAARGGPVGAISDEKTRPTLAGKGEMPIHRHARQADSPRKGAS